MINTYADFFWPLDVRGHTFMPVQITVVKTARDRELFHGKFRQYEHHPLPDEMSPIGGFILQKP